MILYLDTSALVALYISEDISRRVRRVRTVADRILTSTLAYPEAVAAFSRKRRTRELTEREHVSALNAFKTDWSTWVLITLDRRLLPEITRVLKYHDLTGADAVHLVSALLPQRRLAGIDPDFLFACNDDQLQSAATLEGLASAW